MAHPEMVPFSSIVDQLRQFCAQSRSGAVFIVSDDNRMAQVYLERGNIMMLSCRGRRGLDALSGMSSMRNAKMRFDENMALPADGEAFNSDAILALLSDGAAGQAPQAAMAAPAPRQAAARPRARASLATLEAVLANYIGPMAQIVCADHADAAGDLRALVMLLAAEIPDPKQAANFRVEALRSIAD